MSSSEPHGTPQQPPYGDPSHGQATTPSQGDAASYGDAPNGGGRHGGHGNHYSPQRIGSQPGVPVGFTDAIKRFYAKYAQFSGRASRSEYWWVALYLGAIYFVLSILSSTAGTNAFGEPNGFGVLISLLLLAFALAHVVPSIALGIRRLHDVNMSGWFYLLGLIPFFGGLILVVFMVLPPKPEGARFDR